MHKTQRARERKNNKAISRITRSITCGRNVEYNSRQRCLISPLDYIYIIMTSVLVLQKAGFTESSYQYLKIWVACLISIWTIIFKNGCGILMSQATLTKISMLFEHNYGKLFWKFDDHSFNFSFVHGHSWLRVLESIHSRYHLRIF